MKVTDLDVKLIRGSSDGGPPDGAVVNAGGPNGGKLGGAGGVNVVVGGGGGLAGVWC